jgi:hypothetical protein
MLVHVLPTNNNDLGSCFILPNVSAALIYSHSRRRSGVFDSQDRRYMYNNYTLFTQALLSFILNFKRLCSVVVIIFR